MLPGEDERRRARKDCLTAGGIALISMAAVAGVIAYSIFTVLFLIKDRHVCGGSSPVWTYVVLSMIFNLVVSRARRTRRDDDGNEIEVSKCSKLVYRLSAPVYNVVYGTIVIHGSEQCADIKQTGLWVIAQMTYYISMVIIIAIIALLLAETLTVPSDSLPVDLHEAEELPAARDTHASTALPRAEAVPVFSDAVLAIGVTLAVSVNQISIAQATEVQEASVIV